MERIKGWKKLHNSDTWVNVSKSWDALDEPLVDVRRAYRDGTSYVVQIRGVFVNKKTALKVATDFMRSHPNG